MRELDPRIRPSAHAGGGMDRRVRPGDDNRELARAAPRLALGLYRARRRLASRRAVQMIEEFAEHDEMIAPALGFAADRAQHVVQFLHQ